LLGRTGGDDAEGPRGLDLELREFVVRKELNQARHDPGGDDLRDGRVVLQAEELTQLCHCLDQHRRVVGRQRSHQLRQLLTRCSCHFVSQWSAAEQPVERGEGNN
jgi:hypothetical protein